MQSNNLTRLGYKIGVFGVVSALIWIGIFKFFPTEAEAIKPLVSNHFAMSWLYSIMSDQAVSILIAIPEIVVGVLLLASIWKPKIGSIAGMASTIIFISTLSFLLTTPGIWKTTDGFLVTDFFIWKDIPLLAVSLMVWGNSKQTTKP